MQDYNKEAVVAVSEIIHTTVFNLRSTINNNRSLDYWFKTSCESEQFENPIKLLEKSLAPFTYKAYCGTLTEERIVKVLVALYDLQKIVTTLADWHSAISEADRMMMVVFREILETSIKQLRDVLGRE